ncbi:hypothetical protein ACI78Q_06720 [Geodermatophilus sp. SYSU D00705]
MTGPEDTWLHRSLRRFALGSGPLKRGSDRVEVAGRLVVAASLVVAPPLAVAATTVATDHLESLAAVQAAERHPASAVLLEDARRVDGADVTDPVSTAVPTRAVWTAPGGASHEGEVQVRPGTAAGTAVPVWVDDDGDLTSPPLDAAGIPASAMAVGAVFLIGVPLGTWTLHVVLCCALDVQRDRRWERGWAAVEPDWATRLL